MRSARTWDKRRFWKEALPNSSGSGVPPSPWLCISDEGWTSSSHQSSLRRCGSVVLLKLVLDSATYILLGLPVGTMGVAWRSLIAPLSIARFFQIFLTCTAFSLVASVNGYSDSYGVWCMFTWCFCFIVSVLIVVLEVTGVGPRLPLSWEDFTSAFAMLATLMIFTTSIMYPSVFLTDTCKGHLCACKASATAMSILCFVAYSVEVGLTRAKPGEISGFLSTVPGLLKVFEAYVACLIFSLLNNGQLYNVNGGRQWCMAVFCICFIITVLIIVLTIGRLLTTLPLPFDKLLIGYNILAVLMYLSAAIVWPIFSFKNNPRPANCAGIKCYWDSLLGATFLTYINLVAYIIDLVYSTRMVFFTSQA